MRLKFNALCTVNAIKICTLSATLLTLEAIAQLPTIPSQELGKTLNQIAEEFSIDLAISESLVAGKTAPVVEGADTAIEALRSALRNTDLIIEQLSSGAFVVRESATVVSPSGEENARNSDVKDVEVIVVTAGRYEQSINTIARSSIVIAPQTLQKDLTRTSNIGDLLGTRVPGFGAPSATDISRSNQLRGRDPQYLLDGVPLSFNGGAGIGGFALTKFDPEIIERVEVIYGPNSVYGAGATGGVIQFFTKQAADEDPFSVSLRLQSTTFLGGDDTFGIDTSYKPTISVLGDLGKFDYLASYSFDKQKALIDGEGDISSPVYYGFSEENFYFAKLGYEFTREQRLEAFYNYQDVDYDVSGLNVRIADDGRAVAFEDPTVVSPQAPITPFNEKEIISVKYEHSKLFGGALELQYYSRKDERVGGFVDLRANALNPGWPTFWPSNYQATFLDESDGFRSRYYYDINSKLRLTAGIDIEDQERQSDAFEFLLPPDFDQTGMTDGTAQEGLFGFPFTLETLGIFGQAEYRINEKLRFSAGIRWEDVEFSIGAGRRIFERTLDAQGNQVARPGGSGENDGIAYNLGLTYDINDNINIFTSFAQGYEVPSLSQVASRVPPEQELVSNEAVEPQIVDNYEIGLRANYDKYSYSIAIFFADSELGQNFIYDPVTNEGVYNRSPQENYGFEAVFEWTPVDFLKLEGLFSWNEGDFDPDGDGPDPEVPLTTLDISPWKASLFADWFINNDVTMYVQALIVGDRDRAFDEGVDLYEINGYEVFDLGLTYELPKGTLNAQINNVFDKTYITPTSQTYIGNPNFAPRVAGAPGRALSLSYSVMF
ncbi:MAG: TonB-dependent receptor [Pseudomonadota bacterium]